MIRSRLLVLAVSSIALGSLPPAADAQMQPPSQSMLNMMKKKPAGKPSAPVDPGSLKPYPGSRPFSRRDARASDAPAGKKGAAATAIAATKGNRKASYYTSDSPQKILGYYKSLHEKAGYRMTSEDSFKTRNGTDASTLGFHSKGRIVVVQVYHGKIDYREYADNPSGIPAGSSLVMIDVSGN